MKALTICQPWAWAILAGLKRVENRTWMTGHRGVLAVHAGKSRQWLCDVLPDGTPVDHGRLIYGAVLGTVEVTDCVRVEEVKGDPFASGPWCWLLRNPVLLPEPIPWAGKPGLFDVPSLAQQSLGLF